MPWLRLWIDILDDPDLDALPEATCWAWAKLLAIAKKHDRNGELPDRKRLYIWMRRPKEKVERWISELMTVGLIDESNGVLMMHGWARWQEPKDRTNAQRQARFKAAHKSPPCIPPEREAEKDTHTDQTRGSRYPYPVTANGNGEVTALLGTDDVRVSESEDLEPFDPGPATIPLPPTLPPDKLKVLDRQTQRWGASNGDRVIGDLLADYSAAIVTAACDHHYLDNGGVLDPKRLGGICRAMQAGTWKISPKARAAAVAGPTNQPGGPTEAELAKIRSELASRPRRSPEEFAGRQHAK